MHHQPDQAITYRTVPYQYKLAFRRYQLLISVTLKRS